MQSYVLSALFLFFFCCFFSFPTLRAQEMFIGCDSLAIAGRNLIPTPDGGFLVETYSVAEHAYPEFGFALVKLDAAGRAEWGRLYPAMMGNERATFHPHAYAVDNAGNIVAAGSAATDPFSRVPAIARFTPHGVPLQGGAMADMPGRYTDLVSLPDNGLLLSGTIDYTDLPDATGARAFAGAIIVAAGPDGANPRVLGVEGIDGETVSGLKLFRNGANIGAVGTINAEGCCVDNPMLLLRPDADGSIRESAVLTTEARESEDTRIVLTADACLTAGDHTLIIGTIAERTPAPGNNPDEMPHSYLYRQSAFVLKLDRENGIVWGRRIGTEDPLAGPYAATVTTGGEIVLTSTNEEDPATLIRLNEKGEIIRAWRLAKGFEKRFGEPDAPPLAYRTVTALAPSPDGGIAGLCRIDLPAEENEELEEQGFFPHYAAGFFRMAASPVPQCGRPERIAAIAEPLRFAQRPFRARAIPLANGPLPADVAGEESTRRRTAPARTSDLRQPIRIKEVPYIPETRGICGEERSGGGEEKRRELNLTISPNTVFAGKEVMIEYNADGSDANAAVISLLNASSGTVNATLSGREARCDENSGRCALQLQTTGLSPGIYLVRVQAGEGKESAKLHVQ